MRKIASVALLSTVMVMLSLTVPIIRSMAQDNGNSNAGCTLRVDTYLESDGAMRITPTVEWRGAIVDDYIDIYIDENRWTGVQTKEESGSHTWGANWYANTDHVLTAYINVLSNMSECGRISIPAINAPSQEEVQGGGGEPQENPAFGPGGASHFCIFSDASNISSEVIASDNRFKWRTPEEGGGLEFSNVWNGSWETDENNVDYLAVSINGGIVRMYGASCVFVAQQTAPAAPSQPAFVYEQQHEFATEAQTVSGNIISPNGAKSLLQKGAEVWGTNNSIEWFTGIQGTAHSWNPDWTITYAAPDGSLHLSDQFSSFDRLIG